MLADGIVAGVPYSRLDPHAGLDDVLLMAATETFEHILSFANDVGLYAEEIDVATGAALGNFPQAFSHIALVNSARNLSSEVEGPAAHRQRG